MKNCITRLCIKNNKAARIIIVRPYMLTKSTDVMNIVPITAVMIMASENTIKSPENFAIPSMI